MSLYRIFDVAGSGMSAQSVRLNTTASNMANADSISSSVNQTYRGRHPVFSAMLDQLQDPNNAGVEVKVNGIVESPAPVRMEYRPDHPLAKCTRIYLSPKHQSGRRTREHDFCFPFVSGRRGSDEHLQAINVPYPRPGTLKVSIVLRASP